MTHLVFCHGFSYSPDYWANLAPLLSDFTIHHMDLGYYGNPITPDIDEPVIGIGHSLGVIKLMQQNYPFKALIGLNGFVNFLGSDPHIHKRRALELDTFELLIHTSPGLALKFFHHRCGVTLNQLSLNKERLLSDLELLRQSFRVPDNLTLIATQDDIVCPPELIWDNFGDSKVIMLDSGGHGLGYNQAADIVAIINDLIHPSRREVASLTFYKLRNQRTMTWTTPDVQSAFNKAQPTYDSTATVQHSVANQLVDYLPGDPFTSIVDLGCGTGFITDALLVNYPDSHFQLIDLSDQMIAGCREKYKHTESITFAIANMDEYSYPPADLIISNLAVQWSKDLRALLSNLTSKAPTVAFTTLTQGTFQEWEDLLDQNGITSPLLPMMSAQELTQICNNLNLDSRIYLQDYKITFPSISDFIQYLRNLGATVGNGIQEKAKFKALIQHHKEPITVTYKVLFCIMTSKYQPVG